MEQELVRIALATGAELFSCKLRRAEGSTFGIDFRKQDNGLYLFVDGVQEEGAVASWNRMCTQNGSPERALRLGDKIVAANSILFDAARIMAECITLTTVKFYVLRGGSVEFPAAPDATD